MPRSEQPNGQSLSLPEAFALACKQVGPLEIHATHRSTGAEQTLKVGHPFAVIGRAAAAGVRLDDPSVSQCHAYLQVVEGLPFCMDLGSRTGVVWDDGSQGRGWVHPGQSIRVGAFDLRIGSPDDGVSTETPPEDPLEAEYRGEPIPFPATLEIHATGGIAPVHHPLERPITLVGRHPNCNVRLLDDAVTYFHCVFVNTSDGLWLVDVLSRKGTLLNGRITRLARIRDGDLLEIGKASLVVRTDVRQTGQSLIVNAPVALQGEGATSTALQERVAESVAGAFTPFRDMLVQFQQCFVTMAQMFTALQQEQANMVCEQMRQIQDLSRELRELRTEVWRHSMPTNGTAPHIAPEPIPTPAVSPPPPTAAAPPAPPPTTPESPAPQPPTPKVSEAADAKTLADAHAWFLDRLAKMSQQLAGNPKSN